MTPHRPRSDRPGLTSSALELLRSRHERHEDLDHHRRHCGPRGRAGAVRAGAPASAWSDCPAARAVRALRERFGDRLLTVAHDARDRDGAAGVVERAVARFGGVDVLVNNAGVGQVGAAEEITDAALRDMLDQHLLGPAAFVRAVLPVMRARGTGAIVQMSSQGGRISFPAVGSYSAGKFALEGWSEALARRGRPVRRQRADRRAQPVPHRFNAPGRACSPRTRDPTTNRSPAPCAPSMADCRRPPGGRSGPRRGSIRQVLDDPEAPLRLPLGAEAVRNLSDAYERTPRRRRVAGRSVSESADFPECRPGRRAFAIP